MIKNALNCVYYLDGLCFLNCSKTGMTSLCCEDENCDNLIPEFLNQESRVNIE